MSKRGVKARPKKRHLVRWNDDLDELLLLTVWSVCKKQAVRIPWEDVAKTMGVETTGGAIEQHLKKLHTRRVQANKRVPPAPTRGSGGEDLSTPQKASSRVNKRSHPTNGSPSTDEEWMEDKALTRHRAGKRKLTQPRYTEIADVEYEYESMSSDSELVASGASFLELPNDRHQEASRSLRPRVPSTPTKMISYKCPKDFLASLNNNESNGINSCSIPNQGAALEQELPPKTEPVLKTEAPAVETKSMLTTYPIYDALLQEDLSSFWGYSDQSRLANTTHFDGTPSVGFPAHTTSQPHLEENTMYIPTGDTASDLPPIGDIFSESLNFNDPLPPIQRFQMNQPSVADRDFEDMLGEYFISPGDADWYNEQACLNSDI